MKNNENTIIELECALKNVESDMDKYDDVAFDLLHVEAIDKIRRYGRDGYKNKYMLNPSENVSQHMQSFIYLKNMEISLKNTNELILSELFALGWTG
jgi:hypothetical protein